MIAKVAAIAMAFFRPTQSPIHPCAIAPMAAPAVKKVFTVPMMFAVYELVAMMICQKLPRRYSNTHNQD